MTTWRFNVSGGSWFDSDDWLNSASGNGVPGSGDTAVINNGGTADLGATDDTIGSLVLDGGAVVGSATLTATGGSQLTSGAIGGSVILKLSGTTVAQGFTIGGYAQVINNGVVQQTTGAITIGDNSGIDASFTNAAGATYAFANPVSIASGASTATFVNNGTLETLSGTGSSSLTVSTVNSGTISIASGTTLTLGGSNTQLGGTISGAGTLNLSSGDDVLESGLSLNVGAFEIGVTGYTTAYLGANLTVSGNFTAAGAYSLFDAYAGLVNLQGHTLTLNGSDTFYGVLNGALWIGGGGALITNGASTFTEVEDGPTITLASGTNWTNSATASIEVGVQLGDATASTALTNTSSGVYDFIGDYSFYQGAANLATINNAGLIEKTAGTGVSHIYAAVTNTGTISAKSGALEFDDNVSGSGIANSGAISAIGGAISVFGAVSNSGTISASNGEIFISGAVTNSGMISAYGGAIVISGALTNTNELYAQRSNIVVNGATTNTKYIYANAGYSVDLLGGGVLGGLMGGGGGSVVLAGLFQVATGHTVAAVFKAGASLSAAGMGTAYFSGAGTTLTEGTVAVGSNGGAALWLEDDVIWKNEAIVSDYGNIEFGASGGDVATLDNVAGATFDIIAEGTVFQIRSNTASGVINNAGVFVKTAGNGVSDIQAALNNTGTVSANSGILEFDGGGTLGGTIGSGAGEVILDGTFAVGKGQTQTVTFGSAAQFAGTGTQAAYLSGAGTIVTKGTLAIGSDGGEALVLTNGVTWKNQGTVTDNGQIWFGAGNGDYATLNNVAGSTFNISAEGVIFEINYSTVNGTIVNAGRFAKSSGSGVSDIRVAVDNAGVISASSGALEFDAGGVLGGTIGGGAGQVILEGAYTVASGQTETVTFGSGAQFSAQGGAAVALSGAGTIVSSGSLTISGNGGDSVLLENYVTWKNQGTVDDSGTVVFGGSSGDKATFFNVVGATLDLTADGDAFGLNYGSATALLDNGGTLAKTAGTGVSTINLAIVNTGTTLATSGELDFRGAITGGGMTEVGDDAIVQVDSAVAAAQTLSYAAGGGEFVLNDVSGQNLFAGKIQNFGADDSFDVANFGQVTSFNFIENSNNTGGQLQISTGSTVATLNFTGNCTTANFSAASDNNNGTVFSYSP